jgi:hypothetical protein
VNIKQVMKCFGVHTFTDLARIAGVTQPAVSNWVRRGHIPELAQRRLADLSLGKLKVSKRPVIKSTPKNV